MRPAGAGDPSNKRSVSGFLRREVGTESSSTSDNEMNECVQPESINTRRGSIERCGKRSISNNCDEGSVFVDKCVSGKSSGMKAAEAETKTGEKVSRMSEREGETEADGTSESSTRFPLREQLRA
jgi:hypothetical protein